MNNKQAIRFMMFALGSLLLGLLMSSCVNLKPKPDPVKLYALGPIESQPTHNTQRVAIYVARPDLPAYLDGKRLQYRNPNGEIDELGKARWAEPLEEGIARSVSEFLMAKQPVSGFYPWPNRVRDSSELLLKFYKLGALSDGTIRMVVDWELRDGVNIQQSGCFESSAIGWDQGNAESLVAGLNQALQQLAESLEEKF
mgnify:CR=1 FL=1